MGTFRGRGRNLDREHNLCKGPGAGSGLGCWKNIEEARLAGAEWVTGREGGGEDREGTGRSCRALWASGRTWAFPPVRWEPWRALGRGGWDLAQVLMGTLWWLLREGQTEGRSRVTEATATALVQGELGCWSRSA